MKATVNNSANFVINNDMLNETKCLKYVSKPTMLEEIVNIQKNSEIAENARTGYRFGLGVARSIVRKLEEKATKRRE